MRTTDPNAMSAAERVGEVGEILAAGIQRFLAQECKAISAAKNAANGQNPLADCGRAEASWSVETTP